jgi:hypothetical protein
MSRATFWIFWTTCFRIHPDFSRGCVETTIAVGGGSSWLRASRAASTGFASTTSPCAAIPSSRSLDRVRSSRRPADARRVSS